MKRLIFALLALPLAYGVALADNKIGVINLQKIVQQSPDAEKFNKELQATFKPRQEELMKLGKDLQAKQQKFASEQSKLSPKKRQEAETKLETQKRDLQKQAQAYQQDLTKARNKDLLALDEKVRKAVSEVGKDGGFTVIIDKQSAPFSIDSTDVTDEVMKKLS